MKLLESPFHVISTSHRKGPLQTFLLDKLTLREIKKGVTDIFQLTPLLFSHCARNSAGLRHQETIY